MIEPIWRGETVYILGCGPSLTQRDVDLLQGQRVIAINDSFLMAPWADVLYGCDARWWRNREQRIRQVWEGGIRVTLENDIPGVVRMRNTGESGLETDPSGLRNGKNSGYQAINLAYHFGVSKIVLLGYDMKLGRNGELHWNARPELQTAPGFARTLSLMLPLFDTLVEPLATAGVQVVNATPGSALRAWPLADIQVEMRASWPYAQHSLTP